ncbi:MAG: DNA repair protein RecO [Gemmatimonadales bacterium]
MTLVAAPAVILQTFRYSETSKVVRLATRDLGVQSGIAKGALRPRSPFGAGLELLSEGVAQLYHRETRELHTIAAFDVTDLHRGLAGDVGRFAGATALVQVLLKMAPPAPVPAAYDTFVAALGQLERAGPAETDGTAVRWLWILLGALGFAPAVAACVRDGTPIEAGENGGVTFSVAEGGVLCGACARSLPEPPARLPARAYRDLVALTDPAVPLPALDAPYAAAHRRLVARFVRHHLGEADSLSALDFWERRSWAAPLSPRSSPVPSAAS